MNKEEILNSKPGRTLDREVAVKVMDYIWMKHLFQFSAELAVKWLGTKDDLEQAGGVYVVVPESQFISLKERENVDEAVLDFSTGVESAELVVKHMQELGYEYNLVCNAAPEGTRYCASFGKQGKEAHEHEASCTNVPEAIVKAALLTLL